jgi:transcriptional regulator with XRE-family HTH domain
MHPRVAPFQAGRLMSACFRGCLPFLGRALTQSELVRAIRAESGETISQSNLSLIEKGTRRHLSHESRQLLARFFKVHPGYLVSDPPGFHTELTSDIASIETVLDRWLGDGATRFAHDPPLSAALERLAAHAETRRCLILLGEMIMDAEGGARGRQRAG